MARHVVWSPSGAMLITDNSKAWQNNVDMVMEASREGRYDAADLLIKVEISRHLDRIANALEKSI